MKSTFTTLTLTLISLSAHAGSFAELCNTSQDLAVQNTISILKEKVGVTNSEEPHGCEVAGMRLEKLTDLELSATRFTGPWKNIPLNPITNLDALATLPQLRKLNLVINEASLSPLAALPSLKVLTIYPSATLNGTLNISPLSSTKLESLSIESIPLASAQISALNIPTLARLNLRNVGLVNLSLVGQLKNLRSLDVANNPLTTLNGIEALINLEALLVARASFPDLSPLSTLTNLRSLDLPQCQINDIGALATLKKLENLDLVFNNVTDISVVKQLPSLRDLDIARNNVASVAPLAGSVNLESLNVLGIPACDLAALDPLKQSHLNDQGKLISLQVKNERAACESR